MSNKLILFMCVALSGPVYAQQDSADLARSVYQNNLKQQSTGAAGVNETSSGTSIAPAAAEGQNSQSAGSGMNAAAGAALIAAGMAMKPPNMGLIAMGMMALAQAAADSAAADKSAATYASAIKETKNPDLGKGKGGYTDPNTKAAQAKLDEAGMKVTADGVKLPDGTFAPSSSFGSSAGMAAAGMDPASIKEAQKVLGALNDEMSKGRVSGVAVSEGGGGGSPAANNGEEFHTGTPLNPWALNAAQKKQMVAGKTVMFDGDPIGVKGQDIFEMVHVAYERKRQTNHFMDAGVSVRSPASVTAKSK